MPRGFDEQGFEETPLLGFPKEKKSLYIYLISTIQILFATWSEKQKKISSP